MIKEKSGVPSENYEFIGMGDWRLGRSFSNSGVWEKS